MNGIHGMHKNIEALTFEGCGYRNFDGFSDEQHE